MGSPWWIPGFGKKTLFIESKKDGFERTDLILMHIINYFLYKFGLHYEVPNINGLVKTNHQLHSIFSF